MRRSADQHYRGTASHIASVLSILLTTSALAQVFDLRDLDAKVERFILDGDVRYMSGVLPSQETPQSRSMTRRMQLLQPEALDSALRLIVGGPKDYKGWRSKVIYFIRGMYRTHPVSEEKHRQVARTIFRELINSRGGSPKYGDLHTGLDFLKEWGTTEDMEMLVPLLKHSDSEVRAQVEMVVHAMARDRHLPDPTKVPDEKPKSGIPSR